MTEAGRATLFWNRLHTAFSAGFSGTLAAFTVAAAATFLSEHYGGPAMLFALLLGIAFNFLSKDKKCSVGIEFTARTLLKIGIALLGLRVSLEKLLDLGLAPILIVLSAVPATILAGLLLARLCGRSWSFGVLTGGAVAICGASAALAIAAVLPRSQFSERDTIFTVIAVTVLSTIAMIGYPLIVALLNFDPIKSGIFLGATIHDVAQVVGAGYSVSETTGDTATYTKLLRVTLLAPVLLLLALVAATQNEKSGKKSLPLPFFVVVFGLLVAAQSFALVPDPAATVLIDMSRWFLMAAIAAIGMKTSLGAMAQLGPKHIWIVVGETFFLALLVLAALWLF